MEDQFLGLITSASVAGVIDYREFDWSARWYYGEAIKLRAHACSLRAQVHSLQLQAMAASASHSEAFDIMRHGISALMPWVSTHNEAKSGDLMDAIADWYRVFGKKQTEGQ